MQITTLSGCKPLVRLTRLFLLASLLHFTPVTTFAETPKPELSWIEEDGTDLPIDWRTASAWIWSRQRFALQLWIEIPRDLGETLKSVTNPDTEMQITSESKLAPFELADNHVFLLIHMRSASEFIEVKSQPTPDAPESQVRALKIEIPFSSTTWMRNANCRRFRPFLTERSRQGLPPFFLALNCSQEPGSADASIEIQGPKDVTLALLPVVHPASSPETKSELPEETNILHIPLGKPPEQTLQQLAKIEVRGVQGDSRSVYDLKRVISSGGAIERAEGNEIDEPPPQLIPHRVPHLRVGAAALYLEADNRGDSPSYSSGLQPGFFAGWRQEIGGSISVIGLETLLPLPLLTFNTMKIDSPNLGWLRVLAEPAAWQNSQVQGVFGLQGFLLGVNDQDQYSSPLWISPSIGLKVSSKKHSANWEALISPITVGSGQNGFGRVLLSLRSELEVRKYETFKVDFFAEAVAIRTLGYDSSGWFANGLNAGLQGDF